MKVALRSAAALVSLALGWALQMAVYLGVANGSPHDIRLWAWCSGVYCVAAMLLIGLPLAISRSAYPFRHPVKASLLTGASGALMALAPPSLALFPITVPLGFLVGGFSMWAYISIVTLLGLPDDCAT